MASFLIDNGSRLNDRNTCHDADIKVAPRTVASVFLVHDTIRDDVVGVAIRLIDESVNCDKQRQRLGILNCINDFGVNA